METSPKKSIVYTALAIIVCVTTAIVFLILFANTLEDEQSGSSFLLGLIAFLAILVSVILIIDVMRSSGYTAARPPGLRAAIFKAAMRSLFWIPLGAILTLLILLIVSVPPQLGVTLAIGSFVAIGITAAQVSGVLRNRRRQAILEYLEQATSLNLPLSRMMHAAAEGEVGLLQHRLRDLAIELEGGQSLAAALEDSVPEIGSQTAGIAAAERIGQLPHMLSRMIRKPQEDEANGAGMNIFYREYAMVYLLLLLFVATMTSIVIMPKFRWIAADFHIQMPQVFYFADFYLIPILSILAGVVVLTSLIFWIGRPLYPSLTRSEFGKWGSHIIGHFIAKIPIVGAFLRDRGMADLCDFVAAALESGTPLDVALTEAAAAQRSIELRERAAAWAGEISSGQPLAKAAIAAGMPALLVGMLPATTDNDSLAAVMRFLAGHFELRWLRAQAIVQSLYIPILVFSMGAAVAVIALSIMEPLSRLNLAAEHFPMGF